VAGVPLPLPALAECQCTDTAAISNKYAEAIGTFL